MARAKLFPVRILSLRYSVVSLGVWSGDSSLSAMFPELVPSMGSSNVAWFQKIYSSGEVDGYGVGFRGRGIGLERSCSSLGLLSSSVIRVARAGKVHRMRAGSLRAILLSRCVPTPVLGGESRASI